jgi:hypothetical protein
VITANEKVKPEPLPEHNDPYRIDWTEVEGRNYIIGQEVSCCVTDLRVHLADCTGRQATRISWISGPISYSQRRSKYPRLDV